MNSFDMLRSIIPSLGQKEHHQTNILSDIGVEVSSNFSPYKRILIERSHQLNILCEVEDEFSSDFSSDDRILIETSHQLRGYKDLKKS